MHLLGYPADQGDHWLGYAISVPSLLVMLENTPFPTQLIAKRKGVDFRVAEHHVNMGENTNSLFALSSLIYCLGQNTVQSLGCLF